MLVQQHEDTGTNDAHFHLFMYVSGCAVLHAYMKEKEKKKKPKKIKKKA